MLAILWAMFGKAWLLAINVVFFGIIAYVALGIIKHPSEWLDLGDDQSEKSAKK